MKELLLNSKLDFLEHLNINNKITKRIGLLYRLQKFSPKPTSVTTTRGWKLFRIIRHWQLQEQ